MDKIEVNWKEYVRLKSQGFIEVTDKWQQKYLLGNGFLIMFNGSQEDFEDQKESLESN